MVTPVPGVVNPTKAKAQTLTEATIEFRDVEYRITITDSQRILAGISLKIHPGETIAAWPQRQWKNHHAEAD